MRNCHQPGLGAARHVAIPQCECIRLVLLHFVVMPAHPYKHLVAASALRTYHRQQLSMSFTSIGIHLGTTVPSGSLE